MLNNTRKHDGEFSSMSWAKDENDENIQYKPTKTPNKKKEKISVAG